MSFLITFLKPGRIHGQYKSIPPLDVLNSMKDGQIDKKQFHVAYTRINIILHICTL